MNILGLGYKIFHNSSASLVDENGKVIFAASEERFSRIKLDSSEPLKTLDYIKENYDFDFVTSPYYDMKRILIERFATTQYNKIRKNISYFASLFPNPFLNSIKKTYHLFRYKKIRHNKTDKIIDYYTGHQDAHAASAYFTSGFNKALILTWDGGINCEPWLMSIQHGNNGEMKRIFSGNRTYNSNKIAWKYSGITRLLGFKPVRHEGKITGLAAYGKYNEKCINDVKKALYNKPFEFYYVKIFDDLTWLRDKYTKEDIAFSIQYMAEQTAVNALEKIKENYSYENICLAGGLFANVRINQKIKESGFKKIFIHPAMGDEGLGVGSALFYLGKEKKVNPYKLKDVYFGPEYSNEEIKKKLDKSKLNYHYNENIELEIAELLAKGKVVARFNGKMEYGPRALGNRSILYQTTDSSVNDWLNKKLVRCYDKETEILTKDGWKFMKNVSSDEIVATLNPKNNCLEYQKIKDKTRYEFKGEMYYIKNNRIDLLVTPQHNFWIKKKNKNRYEFKKIEELYKIKTFHYQKIGGVDWFSKNNRNYFVLPSIIHSNKVKKENIKIPMNLWLEFLGYYLSEGWAYYDNYGHYRVCIAQSKKSKNYNYIKNCIKKMPFNSLYNKNTFVIHNKQLYTYIKKFGKAKEKFISSEFLELPKDKLKILFIALIRGDGNIRGSGYRYATTSKRLADDVQVLAIKLGFSARISIQKTQRKQHNDLYMVRIGKSPVATLRRYQIIKKKYDGFVYCVTVPNHIIFVRRNGKPIFCGNTEFMPFAPVTLKEYAHKCYKNMSGAEHTAKFMTITFDCTDYMKKNMPAVVHVDGTARPQLIDKKTNPSYYKIVNEYYKITKLPSIINTSFNMHEEPIVMTPDDAIRSFQQGHLEYLAIGNYLVKIK